MTGDPIIILNAHNRWATRALIEACAALPPEQFHQRFEMGPGSLHDTVTHILGAMRSWTDFLQGLGPRPRPEGTKRSPQELLALLEETANDLDAVASSHPLDETLTGTRWNRTVTLARGGVITHIATHGMHHRAQCLNMLRRLGVEPLPPMSVLEWLLTEGCSQKAAAV